MTLCLIEQVENFIREVKKTRNDIIESDNEILEAKDLDILAEEAKKLAYICEETSKQIKEELNEEK
jgi:hypothetical protein